MAEVTYIARRRLAPNHFAGTSYELPLSISDLRRPSEGDLKRVIKSLSGAVETLYFGRERIWQVTLAPTPINEAALLYEFLESTADGQVFAFDPYGARESPSQPLNVVREDMGYTEEVVTRQGLGGFTDYVRLSFSVREQ